VQKDRDWTAGSKTGKLRGLNAKNRADLELFLNCSGSRAKNSANETGDRGGAHCGLGSAGDAAQRRAAGSTAMASGGERAKLVEEVLQLSSGLLDPVIQLVRDLRRCSGPGVRAAWSPPVARNRGGGRKYLRWSSTQIPATAGAVVEVGRLREVPGLTAEEKQQIGDGGRGGGEAAEIKKPSVGRKGTRRTHI